MPMNPIGCYGGLKLLKLEVQWVGWSIGRKLEFAGLFAGSGGRFALV